MLTLKYTKKDTARYISHIDLLRQFIKILNRAEVDVVYSKGFHPHMNIYFSPALPVGVGSNVEYCTIESTQASIIDAIRAKSIKGLEFVAEYNTDNPKLASKIYKAKYNVKVDLTDEDIQKLHEFLSRDSIVIEVERKGEKVQTEVKHLIYDYKVSNSLVELTLAVGNPNLRIDKLIRLINDSLGLGILITNSEKIEQYVSVEGTDITVDDYLNSLVNKSNIGSN